MPDFILTSERDVFRPTERGWEPYGDWNARCAQAHAELYNSASSVLAEVVDFVSRQTKARVVYEANAPAGLIATSEEEMDRLAEFIDRVKASEPKFHYQRNTIYLRFCHADYHKGAALEELSRLTEIPREAIFAAGDHHNDISMLDGRYAAFPSCPANAIEAVKAAVRGAGGRVAEKNSALACTKRSSIFWSSKFGVGCAPSRVVIPIRRSAERDLAVAIVISRARGTVDCKSEVPRRLRGSG